ncbi:MAG: hypothetical protein M9949_00065 [Candidatus Kapabacteria bacterium]|nr:hypothetical protein [Candidatus Kapabacteria bacterium]
MFKKTTFIVVLIATLFLTLPERSEAQVGDESFRMKLESILFNFKNYRFSNISVYSLKDQKDIRRIIKDRDEAATLGEMGVTADEECLKGVDIAVLQMIETGVNNGDNAGAIQRTLFGRSLPIPESFDCIFNYYKSKDRGVIAQVRNVYIVTTRKGREQLTPNTIIAMIVSYSDERNLSRNINRPSPTNVYTYPELKEHTLDPKDYRADNLYDLLMNAFMQGMVEDKTLEAQGIGTYIKFFAPQAGVTKSLISNESQVQSFDIQSFKRISEGQALDITDKFNEIIVSGDLISWRQYDYPMLVYPDGYTDTLDRRPNLALPKFGVELKYGIESINYPSFWSERMTVSAIWEAVKLGVILPTSGWSNLSTDVYNLERTLTHAGVGVAGEFDFPFAVIPKSGIFNAALGYVFGDAVEGPRERNLSPDTYVTNPFDLDYLIRYNAQLHYTFAVAIDRDYLLRFGLGGTIYG